MLSASLPSLPAHVAAVDVMLRHCKATYLDVAGTLRSGLSEADIHDRLIEALQQGGVTDYWYDIPVLVLIGATRFIRMADRGYDAKRPRRDVFLQNGDPFFIDIHPRHGEGFWGNFAATGLFHPASDDEAAFALSIQRIQHSGITHFHSGMTGAEIAGWFRRQFVQADVQLLDVRGNYGHSMGHGEKSSYVRHFLDHQNTDAVAGLIYGIEPGGIQRLPDGRTLVGRFEDCVYFPEQGYAVQLGGSEPVPVVFGHDAG